MKEELIEKIINKYTFANKKKKDPDFCPCYNNTDGKKCHNVDDNKLICVFCYCPEYQQDMEIPEGKCKITNNQGFYFKHLKLPLKGIWDCTNCNIPETREYVKSYLEKFSDKELKEVFETNFRTSRSLFEFLTILKK
ncbi:MAG: cysteine-rich small domain-containing protein [Nanoarchaeota archaeon]|nr:cysteine-rich small domain-containing protein [Nanoarchaeota archaeon]